MNKPPIPPYISIPQRIRQLTEKITLADLLESSTTTSDTISMISNIVTSSWMYADVKSEKDLSIERDLFSISQAYGHKARHIAFSHIRDRRQFNKNNR